MREGEGRSYDLIGFRSPLDRHFGQAVVQLRIELRLVKMSSEIEEGRDGFSCAEVMDCDDGKIRLPVEREGGVKRREVFSIGSKTTTKLHDQRVNKMVT